MLALASTHCNFEILIFQPLPPKGWNYIYASVLGLYNTTDQIWDFVYVGPPLYRLSTSLARVGVSETKDQGLSPGTLL